MPTTTVNIDLSRAPSVPTQPVNMVLVQGTGDELFLSLGHFSPPLVMAIMGEEQMSQYMEANPVTLQQLARFSMSPTTARELAKRLQQALGDASSEAAS